VEIPLKIRMKRHVTGSFHNHHEGVKPGDVFEVEDHTGARYCKLGYAEPVVDHGEEERAVAPKGEERKKTPAKAAPKVVEEPEEV
jgi:hypothetical protein